MRVARAVVHAQVGPAGVEPGHELDLAVRDGEAVLQPEREAACRAGHDAADGLADVPRHVVAGCRIEAVQEPGHDVDPEQLIAPGIPEGPFAEIGAHVED